MSPVHPIGAGRGLQSVAKDLPYRVCVGGRGDVEVYQVRIPIRYDAYLVPGAIKDDEPLGLGVGDYSIARLGYYSQPNFGEEDPCGISLSVRGGNEYPGRAKVFQVLWGSSSGNPELEF